MVVCVCGAVWARYLWLGLCVYGCVYLWSLVDWFVGVVWARRFGGRCRRGLVCGGGLARVFVEAGNAGLVEIKVKHGWCVCSWYINSK